LAKKKEILLLHLDQETGNPTSSPLTRNRKSYSFTMAKEQGILLFGQETGNPGSFTLAKKQEILLLLL